MTLLLGVEAKSCLYAVMDLTEVPTGIHEGCTEVHLQGNDITNVPAGVFSNIDECKELNLNDNKISLIENGAFIGLNNLEILSLAGNLISQLPVGVFSPLTQLTELSLNNNDLITIQYNTFPGLTNLEVLDLSANKISQIEDSALTGLWSLKKLWLFENDLETLKSRVLNGVPRPLEIALSDATSPDAKATWKCNTLCWLKHEELAGDITFRELYNYKFYPRCVEDIDWEDLQCMFHSQCPFLVKFFAFLCV